MSKMLENAKSAAEKNWSLLASGMLGLGAVACPCPTCVGGTVAFFLNWLRERLLP